MDNNFIQEQQQYDHNPRAQDYEIPQNENESISNNNQTIQQQENNFGWDYPYENIGKNRKCFRVQADHANQLKNRKITTNRPDLDLCDNKIQTNKYTFVNFFPKNLYEQFSKKANFYFLLIGILQCIPPISISYGLPVIYLPLVVIIIISMGKDFMEDYKRITADREENSRIIEVLDQKGNWIKKKWCNLRVGNVIKMTNDNYVAADILILQSSDAKGDVYIETKNLDGESNLKIKKVHNLFHKYYNPNDPERTIQKYPIIVDYDKPLPYFDRFKAHPQFQYIENGSLEIMGNKSCGINNFLLRAQKMKNTQWIVGLVCYTGHDTKIMQNMMQPKLKRSSVEQMMGKYIIIIFGIQNFLCLFCATWYIVWYSEVKNHIQYIDSEDKQISGWDYIGEFWIYYFTWMLLFTNFVPISLLVTLEVVKFIQGMMMQRDKEFNDLQVQTSNLNEELGQIKYVFCDKTGTLTCNNMEFKKLSIGTQVYGDTDIIEDDERYINDQGMQKIMEKNGVVTNVDFRDSLLLNILNDPNHEKFKKSQNMLLALAICHTVVLTKDNENNNLYSATSPDELALVNFAKFCGYEFLGINRDDIILIKYQNQIHKFKRLQVFEFDSIRQKHSVIIQNLDQEPVDLNFSERFRHSQFKLIDKKTVTLDVNLERQFVEKIQTIKQNITKNQYRITFKINHISSQDSIIGIGIGQSQIMLNNQYIFLDKNSQQHGLYIITNQGIPYNTTNEKKNGPNGPARNFKFKQGDEIELDYNPLEKTLKFQFKDYSVSGSIQNNINFVHDIQIPNDKEFHPIIVLSRPNDSVSIVESSLQKNDIHLYCKGADSSIIKGCQDPEYYCDKMFKILNHFGKTGLRTLLIAERKLDHNTYNNWVNRYMKVKKSPDGKDNDVEESYAEMEQKMNIIGSTAIEDKLQDKVPETIKALREAGIKVWVLTGDKLETAINIGYASKLLDSSMKRFEITIENENLLIQTLQDTLAEMENENRTGNPDNDNYALVISGEAIKSINIPNIRTLIYSIAERCKVLICCRASSKQKELMVNLIRDFEPTSPTLAIGDGANDVNMLNEAHVGIGIKGVEGQQAARASDYSVKEFKDIRKLLFYHGRECYRRNSQIVTYNFYKNVLLVVPQFWYGFSSHFSGQTLYDAYLYQFFNMFYSSIPIMIYAIFDEEVKNGEKIMTENQVRNFYRPGLENRFFKGSVFWTQYIIGLAQAGIIVLIAVYTLEPHFFLAEGEAHNIFFWQTGSMIYTLVVLVVNIKILIFSFTMSIGYWIWICFSWFSYFASWYIFSSYYMSQDAFNTFQTVNFMGFYHFGIILGLGATSLIDWFLELYQRWNYELKEKQISQVKKIAFRNGLLTNKKTNRNLVKNDQKIFKVKINQFNYGFSFSQVENIEHDYEGYT
ncbi:P-type ATPase, cytoplasmic domain N [Pseudocohnilembus persalinus]|uniref:Phospholipid-transporting ATPase n=1 Tax=Pseudocohnilembus persalinus TaxID=266149 RepID=A0A0V0QCL3_PSEPJ|nr:P-type ATPase, cytoplasmic domain N [Pseudocohnilembus persalinus]|eukprot:KRW99867.1 P-type ATPase, cytoplasmic domain N [Pseudocohnilembus persalinus]